MERKGGRFPRALPVLDQQGHINEWLGLGLDITDRKKAELELLKTIEKAEAQRRLYETIIGSTPDLVYVFDSGCPF